MDQDETAIARGFERGAPGAVDRIRRRVRRIAACSAYRIPRTEREDLEQEVMAQLWQAVNRPGYDSSRRFLGFVDVVATRRCIDWLRRRREHYPLREEFPSAAVGPLRVVLGQEKLELAYTALAQLGKPCRELVYLRLGMEMPYGEISAKLGKSENALRVQMFRCIEEARRVIGSLSAQPRALGMAGRTDE